MGDFVWHPSDVNAQPAGDGTNIRWPTGGAVFASATGAQLRYLVPLATEREGNFVAAWQELVFEGPVLTSVALIAPPDASWAAHLEWREPPGGGALRLASVLFAQTTAEGERQPPSAVEYRLVRAADDAGGADRPCATAP
jgi:hypothetical protein